MGLEDDPFPALKLPFEITCEVPLRSVMPNFPESICYSERYCGLCIGGVLQNRSRAAGEAPANQRNIQIDPCWSQNSTKLQKHACFSWNDVSKYLHPKNDWNSPFPTIFAVEAVSFSCRVARRSTLTMTLNIDMWSFQRRVIFDLQCFLLDCGYQTIYCTCTWYTPTSSYHHIISISTYLVTIYVRIYVPYVYLYAQICIYMPYTYCWWQPEIQQKNHLTCMKPCKQWDI